MRLQKRSLLLFLLLFGFVLFIFYFPGTKNQQHTDPKIPQVSPTLSQTVVSITGQCHAKQINPSDLQAFLPDPSCTPGVVDPAVTQDNLATTICHTGYTQTVRPPVSYTQKLKKEQIAAYGYSDTKLQDYEEDHLISLELGGSPTDPKNLWPEPHASFNEKDKVENYLHAQVCKGTKTLREAQNEISTNWYAAFKSDL